MDFLENGLSYSNAISVFIKLEINGYNYFELTRLVHECREYNKNCIARYLHIGTLITFTK